MWFAGKKERNNDKEKIGAIQRDIHDAYDKVQLWEGGPYWATKNIGADKPEDSGYYFWWGDTVGYKREGGSWVASDRSNSNFSFSHVAFNKWHETRICKKRCSEAESEGWIEKKNGTYVLTSKHDAARVHWGGNWRMPTEEELDDLIRKCEWTWCKKRGRNGYFVSGKGDYASKGIFLPATGFGEEESLVDFGSGGGYWSSDWENELSAWELGLKSRERIGYMNASLYSFGLPVRPVQGFTK
jgi:hypothetical protein